jgi:hypothetical protein
MLTASLEANCGIGRGSADGTRQEDLTGRSQVHDSGTNANQEVGGAD